MYGKPGAWTGAVPEESSPPNSLWHRAIPQVPGPLRCQPFGLAGSPSAQRAGRRATLARPAGMRRGGCAGQIAAARTPDPVLRARGTAGLRTELPADPRSVRQARRAARRALDAWGMADLSGDTELLASELVANSVEHANGQPIGFVLRRLTTTEGQAAVTCEVTDSSPSLPEPRDAGPDAERGRGLVIVAALASASGVRTSTGGKTTWFTIASSRCALRAACPAKPGAQARAG